MLTTKGEKLHVLVTENNITATVNIDRKHLITPDLLKAIGMPYEYNNEYVKATRVDSEAEITKWLAGIDLCIK